MLNYRLVLVSIGLCCVEGTSENSDGGDTQAIVLDLEIEIDGYAQLNWDAITK